MKNQKATSVTKKQVRDMIKSTKQLAEMKFLDNSSGATVTYDWNGAIFSLSNVATGTGISNKIGSSIRPKRIELNCDASSSATSLFFRFILFQDNEQLGTTPAVTDILSTIGSSYAIVSPYNFEYAYTAKRFKILADKTLNVGTGGPANQLAKINRLMKGTISFQTGNVNGKNSLYLIVISDQSTAAGGVRWYSRLYFQDE